MALTEEMADVSDELLRNALKRASEYTGIKLKISKNSPGGDEWNNSSSSSSTYVLVDAENGNQLSRVLDRQGVYDILYSINQIFYSIMYLQSVRSFQELAEGQKRKKYWDSID